MSDIFRIHIIDYSNLWLEMINCLIDHSELHQYQKT